MEGLDLGGWRHDRPDSGGARATPIAHALSYPDAAFDRVLSSFVYHHVPADEKAGMLREARRVLKPGGLLCLLDLAGADAGGPLARLHSHRLLAENARERMVARLRQAGFEDARNTGGGSMAFGLLALSTFQGTAPAAGRHAS